MRIAFSPNNYTSQKTLPKFKAKFVEVNSWQAIGELGMKYDREGLSIREYYEKYKVAHDLFYELARDGKISDSLCLKDERLKPLSSGFAPLIGYDSVRKRVIQDLLDEKVEFSIWLRHDNELGARARAQINGGHVYEMPSLDLGIPERQDKMVKKVVKYVQENFK